MKKIISLTLSFLLIISIISPIKVHASTDERLQEAIIKSKELFNISTEHDKFDYHVNNYNGKTVFNLYWRDSSEKLGNINITIDSLGNVQNYNIYKPYNKMNNSKLPNLSKSQAKDKAIAFIEKVSPHIVGKVKYISHNSPLNINIDYYAFKFVRIENNVPYSNNTVSISVNNMTGEITNYYANWDYDLVFPDTKDLLSLKEAKNIFKNDIGLKLVYKFSYGENVNPYLVYTTLDNSSIDAKSGEIIPNNDRYYITDDYALKESVENSKDNLSPEELEAIQNVSSIINESTAKDMAMAFLGIDDGYKVRYSSLNSNWRDNDEYTWNFNFQKKDSEEDNVHISIDAKNGEVKSFNKYKSYEKTDTVVYDKDQALELAKNYIQSFQPEKYSNVEYVTWNENIIIEPLEYNNKPRSYAFKFVRLNDGGYVLDDGFNVTVDTVSGEITNYSYSWYKGALPSTDSIISIDEAYDVLFEKIGLNLEYIRDYQNINKTTYYDDLENNSKLNLVYSINRDIPLNIDPLSGNILDHNGKKYKKNIIVKYEDIDNSFAKDQIEVLTQYGIALPGDHFKPKQNITQREFLYLISKSGNYYYNERFSDSEAFDEDLYRVLINQGIIKENEISPDAYVSRENAVKFVIRALKYDQVADLSDIFMVNFKDVDKISKDLKGYVAIAQGLNIIKGNNGYFYPDHKLTREQGALVIYNLLK